MKRWLIAALACLLLFGCGKNGAGKTGKESDRDESAEGGNGFTASGDFDVYETDGGCFYYTPKKLPFSVPYNETSFALSGVELYAAELGGGHALIVCIVLDVGSIPESGLEQFVTDTHSDTFTKAYLTDDANGMDFVPMTPIGAYYYTDAKEMLYLYLTPVTETGYAQPFESGRVTAEVHATQADTFDYESSDGKTYTLQKWNTVTYYLNFGPDDVRTLSDANAGLRAYMEEQIGSAAP